MDPRHNRIDYVELGAKNAGDYAKTKAFFETAFGWTYQDYGPDYCDTQSSGVGSGINGDSDHRTLQPLPGDLRRGSRSGAGRGRSRPAASCTRAIFSFPGGRRFHFADPSGNELGVWSEK